MNWQAKQEDETGYTGKRRWQAADFGGDEDAMRIVIPRLGGAAALEPLAVELNDVAAQHPTPWRSLVLSRGASGQRLWDALQAVVAEWNVRHANIGLKWRVICYGLHNYRSWCAGVLQGDQPEFWVHLDWLSDRLLNENLAFEARKEAQAAKDDKGGGADKVASDGADASSSTAAMAT